MRIYRSIGWIIALFIALVLFLVAIFSFGFREFVREFIVIPIAYMIWWIGLLVKSTPQVLFWAVILFLAAFITLRSLKPGPQPESPVNEEGYGSVRRERVSFWMIQLYHGSKKYYLGRFMGFLYRLILDVLAFEGRATFSVIEKRLEQGEVEVPEEVKAFIVAGVARDAPHPGAGPRDRPGPVAPVLDALPHRGARRAAQALGHRRSGPGYPRRLVDRACGQAIDEGLHSYGHVKKLTEKFVADALAAIDRADEPRQGELALTQEHPLIRPADIYAELFARCAGAQPSSPQPMEPTPHEHQ